MNRIRTRTWRFILVGLFAATGLLTILTTMMTVAADTTTLNPVADAYVSSSVPNANYGSGTVLYTNASPTLNSYLQFDVQNLSGSVTTATLRMYVEKTDSIGFDVKEVADTSWGESTITYNNAPVISNTIGSSGATTINTWAEVDVTSYITGNGLYSLAMTSSSNQRISYSSREGSYPPELIVNTGSGTPAPTIDFSATPLTGTVPLTVTFTNSSTNADTYLWDFGDGMTSIVAAPMHTYGLTGTFTISLTAMGSTGSDTLTRTAYIMVTGDGPAPPERVTDGLQVLYTFREETGSSVGDVSGVGAPLNLTITNTNAATWLTGVGCR